MLNVSDPVRLVLSQGSGQLSLGRGSTAAALVADSHLQVTGAGHGGQPFGSQLFSLQPPEPGCQLPMAERPAPELQMPVPVTRHPKKIPQLTIRFTHGAPL